MNSIQQSYVYELFRLSDRMCALRDKLLTKPFPLSDQDLELNEFVVLGNRMNWIILRPEMRNIPLANLHIPSLPLM